jgi:hypothetical protein
MSVKNALFKRWIGVPLVYGVAGGMFGCSGVPPTETISTADMALNQAIEAKAAQYAPLELRLAREDLDEAKRAMDEENYKQARRLAEKAQVHAQLAETKAQSEAELRTAQEIQQTIEALRREAEQKAPGI